MRCVSYTRFTSCVPEKVTPSDIVSIQNERIQKYIRQNGWELVGKYTDRKKDATADEAFRTMQRDGVNRKFDMVVVDSLMRCGANVSYAEDILLKSFLPAGIHFAVVEDNVCSLTLTYDEAAAYFKKKRNAYIGAVLHGRTRAKQAEGYLSVHDEKYGYLLNEERKGFVVDEEVVPIIREIFHMIADEGLTYKETAERLNERGYESPMKHLVRVSQKHRQDVESHWVTGAVKRVVSNTAYIGYWYKIVDGERTRLETEPIIDKELFDRASAVAAKRYNGITNNSPRQKSDNAFIKQIFDKQSGEALICRLNRGANPSQSFGLDHWKKETICYDFVMEKAVAALNEEKERAVRADVWVNSEQGRLEKQRRRAIYAKQARKLFDDISLLERERLSEYVRFEAGTVSEDEYQRQHERFDAALAETESQFKRLMDQVDELETAFSNRNPWIALYADIRVPDVLTKEEVRKWIGRVVVDNLQFVEVYLPEKYKRWRDMLAIKETEE